MLFIALLFITSSCVAGAAAFFSVYGLAHTFAASFWSVVFMGGSLEAGKLMLASYLYRFKDTVAWRSKTLGYAFVFVLMMITSLGIYGYLADAYQSGTTDMKQVNASLDLKKQEQATLEKRKTEIDGQIAQVPAADVKGKQRLMRQFGPEVNTINKRLIALTAEIQQEAQKQITTDSHVGPIVFVAKIVGIEPDHAINLLILMIVFAFDPLAIYLTIATNTALAKHNAKKVDDALLSLDPVILPKEEPVAVAPQDSHEVFSQKDADEWYEYEPISAPPTSSDPIQTAEEIPAVEEVAEEAVEPPKPDMKQLGESFSKEATDDVAAEEGTEAPPEQQLAKIYEEVASKAATEQTPTDLEAMHRIAKFFARQNLINTVRTGSVK